MAIARGQITLVDLTDVSFQGFLTSSKSKMQSITTSGSYSPSWDGTANKVTITSEIYQIGQTSNLIQDSMINSINWYYTLGTGARTLITTAMETTEGYKLVNGTNGKPYALEISKNKMTKSNTTLKIECEINYRHASMDAAQTYKLDIDYALAVQGETGVGGATGSTGITTLLSKENYNVPCNQSGTPQGSWSTDSTSVVTVYQGASKLTAIATIAANKQFSIALGTQTGCTASKVGNDGFKLDTVTADSGSVLVNISVRDEKGANQTISKVYTFAKTKAGVNAKNLTITTSANVFTLNEAKTATTPATITLTANAQNLGSSTYTWTYGVDGASPTTSLSGTTNTQTITWGAGSFAKASKSVTYKVVCDGVTSILTIAAIGDGFSPVLLDLTTPLGYVFRNGGTGVNGQDYLECLTTLYKDGSEVSGTAYKWYFQGLAGWELITKDHVTNGFIKKLDGDTGDGTNSVNKKNLQVLPKAVLNVETFKVEATHGGKTYTSSVSLTDLTDPYTVDLVATKGTTFKNGTGSTDIVANTFHQGALVDTAKLDYVWRIFDKNGNAMSVSSITGDKDNTVTVTAANLGSGKIGTVTCEVSEKTPGTGMSLHYKLLALQAMADEQGVEAQDLPEADTKVFKWKLKDLLK